jgi:hypothetical protein
MQSSASWALKMEAICFSETSVIGLLSQKMELSEEKVYLAFEKGIFKHEIRQRQYISNRLCVCVDIIQTSRYKASSEE